MMSPLPIRLTRPEVLQARAVSVARRLLSGAGTASLVAYRHDAQRSLDLPAHGLTSNGELVIAHRAEALPCDPGASTDVRLDLRREAPDARLRILAATAHMLGRVSRLPVEQVEEAVADGSLPESVALAGRAPGMAVALVVCERVLLHDGAGVTPIPFGDLATGGRGLFPSAHEEFDAHELVAALPSDALLELCGAVLAGALPGAVLNERPSLADSGVVAGRIHCVDVDAFGMSLMHVGTDTTSLVFAPFSGPVGDLGQLRRRLAGLLGTARS